MFCLKMYIHTMKSSVLTSVECSGTADNYQEFTDSTKVYEPVSKQLDEKEHAKKESMAEHLQCFR